MISYLLVGYGEWYMQRIGYGHVMVYEPVIRLTRT